MKSLRYTCAALVVAWAAVAAGCEVFEDQAPKSVSFRMEGAPGDSVAIIFSKEFLAGTSEAGVTQVRLFGADTLRRRLPIDTVIDVRVERQLLISAFPESPGDTVNVTAEVFVDGRNIFDDVGKIYPDNPWIFLYRFNAPPTQSVQIVF
ncbi:MAG: hypothetical protein AMXMBFR53_39070 [Gemmatimonadota bacterium]